MTWFNSIGIGSSRKLLWIRLDCIKGGQIRDWSCAVCSLAVGRTCHASYVSSQLPDKEWYPKSLRLWVEVCGWRPQKRKKKRRWYQVTWTNEGAYLGQSKPESGCRNTDEGERGGGGEIMYNWLGQQIWVWVSHSFGTLRSVVSYRRIGKACRLHLEWQSFLWPLKMGLVSCPESSVWLLNRGRIGYPETSMTNQRCVIFQKRQDLKSRKSESITKDSTKWS